MSEDFLTEKSEVTTDAIAADREVKGAVMEFARLTMEVGEAETQLTALKEALEKANFLLTSMLIERSWTALPIAGGRKIELKEAVYARFPKDDFAAQKWLEDNGGGELIEPSITVAGHENDVIEALESIHADFEKKTDVNTNSLQAFFRRKL